MTINEVVDKISRARVVEKIVEKVTENGAVDPDSLPDLVQDIYMSLLKDNHIVDAYLKNQHKFYISRIVMNNICSSSSPYYRVYIKPNKNKEELVIEDADD